jgi:hypothetical protein
MVTLFLEVIHVYKTLYYSFQISQTEWTTVEAKNKLSEFMMEDIHKGLLHPQGVLFRTVHCTESYMYSAFHIYIYMPKIKSNL